MLKIIIVEDNEKQRKTITEIVETMILRDKIDTKILVSTGKVNEVIPCLNGIDDQFIAFLDIDLKQSMNGLKLGEYMRDKWPQCFLVFITSHSEMSYLTFEYKLEALDFIVKNNINQMKYRIEEVLKKALERIAENDQSKNISIETEGAIINIPLEEILFFETTKASHKIRMHSKDREIEFYGTLSAVVEKLDESFFRCHKSIIVNKKYIKAIDKLSRTILLYNGEKIIISFRYLREAVNSFKE